MFVGHSFLAFALVGAAARAFGWSRERALRLAIVGAFAAAAPDVDMLFSLDAVVASAPIEAFWTESVRTHRLVTHSLVLAPVGAVVAGLAAGERSRLLACSSVVALAAVGLARAGTGNGALLAALGTAVLATGFLAGAFELGPLATAGAVLVALASHPFGDLFTGTPPKMLWPLVDPLGGPLVATRVAPFADPTVDFLLAFGVELAAVWAGTLVAVSLLPVAPLEHPGPIIQPRAVAATAYAGTVLVLPMPTVDFAWPFVASVLPVGLVGIPRPRRRPDLEWWTRAWLSALATVTIAVVSWGLAYALL